MTKTEVNKKFEEFYEAFKKFMGTDEIPDKEHSVWRVAGNFDIELPGIEAEFIPELNDIKEISDAFENGENFAVPFVTAEILKLSLGTGNEFWLGRVQVLPKAASNDVGDFGFEIMDWNGRVLNEYFMSDYYGTEIDLLVEGADFEKLADDINAFYEGYGQD